MRRIRHERPPKMPLPVAEIPPQDEVAKPLIPSADFVGFDARKLSEEQRKFLVGLLMWGTQTRACMETRTSPFSVEEWKKENKNFLAAYDIIMSAIGDVLEDKALRMAMAGNEKLLIKLLQGYKPDKYGHKVQVGGPSGGPIPLTIADLARGFADEQSQDDNRESQGKG